jgi:hypothetical protein
MNMATPKKQKTKTPKLSDTERHKRFVDTARNVEASEKSADFERVFKKIVTRKNKASPR